MTVYVDDVLNKQGRMLASHLWADSEAELVQFAKGLGLSPVAGKRGDGWSYFNISLGMKDAAIARGAERTDRFGPAQHVATARKDYATLDKIAAARVAERTHPNWRGVVDEDLASIGVTKTPAETEQQALEADALRFRWCVEYRGLSREEIDLAMLSEGQSS